MSCSPYDMLIYNKFLTLPQYKEINRFLNCELLKENFYDIYREVENLLKVEIFNANIDKLTEKFKDLNARDPNLPQIELQIELEKVFAEMLREEVLQKIQNLKLQFGRNKVQLIPKKLKKKGKK